MATVTNEQIVQALKASHGMVYVAAEAISCSPNTIKRRCRDVKWVREALEHERERALDVAETALMHRVEDGDVSAIKYLLSCRGKERGYGESLAVTARVEHDVAVTVRTELERKLDAISAGTPAVETAVVVSDDG